jgi:MEDS: MEthanogen/methylotroph, DcmR Sensory domain/STAS domain
MMMSPVEIDRLQPGDHVCWAFDDDAEALETMQRFVTDGIAAGDKVHCLASDETDELRAGLQAGGVDTAAAEATDQLQLDSGGRSFLASGWFAPEEVLAGWKQKFSQARDDGYRHVRVIADMSWALDSGEPSGAGRLAWYEAQASRLFADGYSTVVCLYDQRRVSDADLAEISMSHPACTLAAVDGLPWPQLRLRRRTPPAVLRLTGEADLSTRRALDAVVSGLSVDFPDAAPITVDVSGLEFADGATALAMVRAARAAPAGLRVIGASAALAKLIALVSGGEPAGLTVVVRSDPELPDGGGEQ